MTGWMATTVACLTAILPAQVWAAQGVVIAQTVTTNGKATMSEVQVTQQQMRADIDSPNGRQTVIFNGPKQVLYMINTARKTYVEMTKADADQLSAQMSGMMAQAAKMLESMPPAQRAQMEAMLKGRGGAAAAPQYTRTGSDKVGRWTCDKYDVTMNGQKIGEVCSVNPTVLGFGARDFDVMLQMGAFYSAMAPPMAGGLTGPAGIDPRGGSDFPVKTVMIFPGGTATTELIEAGRRTFADALFTVPAGFTKQDSNGAMGGRGAGAGR